MKIRIQDHSIRVRVSMSELKHLASGEELKMGTNLGNVTFQSIIRPSKEEFSVKMEHNELVFLIPNHYFSELHSNMEEGFYLEINAFDQTTKISIEKDFKCIGRDSSMNEGMFPNPKDENSC